MKKLLFVTMIVVCTMCASAQVRIGAQVDSVRMYDQMKRSEGDNPTIGIIPNYNLSPFGVVT